VRKALGIIKFLAILYLFFLCIELMGGAFKLFGREAAAELLVVTDNPIIALMLGILATSLVQSSSTTTSIIVGMVAAGSLTIEQAVPMVMGANIGTTITATIVSLGHMRRRREFELAFAGATVHDFFNFLAVLVFLPLEMLFHPIQRLATALSGQLLGVGGATFNSPLKAIVKPVVKTFVSLGEQSISDTRILAALMLALAVALLVLALSQMVKTMHGAFAERIEAVVHKYLFRNTFLSLAMGILLTALVQSSSVTTSVVVPLIGAGIVQISAAFPYMVGSNIGTTVTAILASLVTGTPAALTIALCHLLFNVFATCLWLPLRAVPIALAVRLGRVTAERRWMAVVLVAGAFFVLPGLLAFLV